MMNRSSIGVIKMLRALPGCSKIQRITLKVDLTTNNKTFNRMIRQRLIKMIIKSLRWNHPEAHLDQLAIINIKNNFLKLWACQEIYREVRLKNFNINHTPKDRAIFHFR